MSGETRRWKQFAHAVRYVLTWAGAIAAFFWLAAHVAGALDRWITHHGEAFALTLLTVIALCLLALVIAGLRTAWVAAGDYLAQRDSDHA